MKPLLLLVTLWLAMATPLSAAVTPDEMLDDPVLEARARALGKELRCLVCQNQSIDDSDADLAADLRRLVRERLKAGDTDEEVKAYLVARYGDFVLLKPPVRPYTWLLWAGPFGILAMAGAGMVVYLRRRRTQSHAEPQDLTEDERRRLAELLREEEGSGGCVPGAPT